MLKTLIIIFLNFYSVISSPVSAPTCQSSCHELVEGKINVHIVPHSHDDVGWVQTYSGYYYGTGNFDQIKNAGVQYILNSTIVALTQNPDRRYIQVETAFFYKWWNDQDDDTKAMVRDLVNSGQLEMVNGAWSMNDEATTVYPSIIDQYTWGFRFLEETVGECGRPKVGWQIDPFGHSREHAYINKLLGFDGLVIGRLDYRDKNKRIEEKNLDFIWDTNDNFDDEETNLLTTMFPNFYVYESGFCFDVYCSDPELTDENLESRVALFRSILDNYANYYKTPNILIPMGHDFSYQKAEKNFGNIDKLIQGFALDDTYNLIYSTPSCYLKAVKESIECDNIQLTVKTDDFFPYASDQNSYWTGYFSSRPSIKRFERVGNSILQSVKQLATFAKVNGDDQEDAINDLRRAMGVLQHHDAITGTEKQAVDEDYRQILFDAIKKTEEPISNIITNLLKKGETSTVLPLTNCLRRNVSICDESKQDRFIVVVHNPLSKRNAPFVRVPVDGESYIITTTDSIDVPFDIFDSIHPFDYITDGKPASKELVFHASDLPPLGIRLYYVEQIDVASDNYHPYKELTFEHERIFGDEALNGFTIDPNGKLSSIIVNKQRLNITQDFYYYKGFDKTGRASGAYVFRPDGNAVLINAVLSSVKFAMGSLVDEVHQVFDHGITQIIRVYKDLNEAYKSTESYIEFDWLIGDLQVDSRGKEVITRFTVSDFKNNGVFYTDSNGRQEIKRVRDQRTDYEYDPTVEPVTSNYYPVSTKIAIEDEEQKLRVILLTDRAQGGSNLKDGVLELMVHRREVADDEFGVEEVLNETQYGMGLYVRGKHRLTFGKIPYVALERYMLHEILFEPLVLVGDAARLSLENLQANFNFEFIGLTQSLPNSVKVMTVEPWKDDTYLLRLEHLFAQDEHDGLSDDTTIDISNLFATFNITEFTPVKLGATPELETLAPDPKIVLRPMDIKTFIVKADKLK